MPPTGHYRTRSLIPISSMWSVGEAPGPPAVTRTIVLYNGAANVSASEGSNQAKLSTRPHPQCSACS